MLTLWQTQRRQEAISAGITKDGLRQESVKLRDVPRYSKLRSVGGRRIAHKAVSIEQSGFGGGTLRSEQRRILQRRTNKKPLSDTRLRGFSLLGSGPRNGQMEMRTVSHTAPFPATARGQR